MKMAAPIPERWKELMLAYLYLVRSRISGDADHEFTEKEEFALKIWLR